MSSHDWTDKEWDALFDEKKRDWLAQWFLPGLLQRRPSKDHPDPDHLRQWKRKVLVRDEAHCRMCGCHESESEDKVLEVHHMTYERFGEELLEDGLLLCRPCHRSVTAMTQYLRSKSGG